MSTTADPEPSARVLQRQPWPFRHCPSCGYEEFEVSSLTGHVVFSCQGCSRSWRYVLGYLQELPARTDPVGVGGLSVGAGTLTTGRPMPLAGQG